MIKDTGGQAFPAFEFHQGYSQMMAVGGMTVRDYFAAHAVQAMLSDPSWREDMTFEDTAYAAYKQADEMLKVRKA